MREMEKEIYERHSVRSYTDREIEPEKAKALYDLIDECNEKSGLEIKLVLDAPEVFKKSIFHYGWIKNAKNYFALIGKKDKDLEEKAGYYGEMLVLKAQSLGLNTCWIAGTYSRSTASRDLAEGEELACIISVGYGETQGKERSSKNFSDVSKTADGPEWYKTGVSFALLAPTAINQQKFTFELKDNNKVSLTAGRGPYSLIDKGIVRLHFELGAGRENFVWEDR